MATKKQSLQVEWSAESGPVEVEVRKRGGARLDDWETSGFESGPAIAGPQSKTLARGAGDQDISLPFWLRRRNCMNTNQNPRRYDAFTLIEMLVVIGIIAILAGILLPALSTGKTRAKVKVAESEMKNIATAIAAYDNDYSRPPASQKAEAAATAVGGDFTFGTRDVPNAALQVQNGAPYGHEANNSELMEILAAVERGANLGNKRNPRKTVYFNAKQVSGDAPGLETSTYIFRDPFGNPYIITLDINDDNKCRDAFYSKNVSERSPGDNIGFHGLTRPAAGAPFEVNGPVMIWTFGPDRKADDSAGAKANAGVNQDNILSWK